MQDRYAGDIGDYLKLAILRTLAEGHKLGVAWWLYPDEHHNSDGRHVGYLNRPDEWRPIDPSLFDKLRLMVQHEDRSVRSLERLDVLQDATFFNEPLSFGATPAQRRTGRSEWFTRLSTWAADRDLLFLDPDNGFAPAGYSAGSRKAGKSVTVEEVALLGREGRSLVVYHHQTRRAGGHQAELRYWKDRLLDAGCARLDAVRAAPFSARAFFLINGSNNIRGRLEDAVSLWRSPKITWHPLP